MRGFRLLSGRSRWIRQFIGLFCLCCLLVVSCSRSVPVVTNSPASSQHVTIGTTANLRTLDPADAYESFSGNLLYNLGDRLYTYELGTTQLKPQLATELPAVSKDGLTYTIPLRRGVVFHDGEPFNAKAMAFSLQRFIQNGGSPSFLLSDAVEKVEPAGDYELTIKLKKPFAAFPALLAFSGACAISPKAYEIGDGKFQPKAFVGTGAYKLVRYGTDSIQLEAFDRYWGKQPANRGIVIQVFSSSANLFNAFRTGAVDIAYQTLDLEQIQNLRRKASSRGWQAVEASSGGIYYLSLNLKQPPLDQVAVRRAIATLMDRSLLEKRVFSGQIKPLYSLLPTTSDVYQPVFQRSSGEGNVEAIQAALAQAGYSKTNPLKFEFWYRSNLTSNALAAITLRAAAQRYAQGAVQIDLKSIESATAYQNLDKGVYPIFLLDWTPDFFDPDNYIQPFMECTKGSAQTGCEDGSTKLQGSFYFSDRVNQLIAESRKQQNPETRKQLFAQLQTILAEDVPFIPLWQNNDYLFAQKWIKGASIEVTQKIPFWTLQKQTTAS